MNLDERRLKEIQELKYGYGQKILDTPNEEDKKIFLSKIEDLENEEKEILKRCKVEL